MLVNRGREVICEALKGETYYVGLGHGSPDWDAAFTQNGSSFDGDDEIVLTKPNPVSVVVKNVAESVTYNLGTDYQVSKATATITRLSGGTIPPLGAVHISYTSERPAILATQTALVDPFGYRKMKAVDFVTPDVAGAIVMPPGKFSISVPRTRFLYIDTELDLGDGAGEQVKEFAVFTNVTLDGGVLPGQMWFTPAEVTSVGDMVFAENIGAITLSNIIKQSFPHLLIL